MRGHNGQIRGVIGSYWGEVDFESDPFWVWVVPQRCVRLYFFFDLNNPSHSFVILSHRRGFLRLQVHKGFDTTKREEVALKVLDTDAVCEIKRECSIASDPDIRAHPLLVAPQCAIKECEELNGRCVIVLKFQSGSDVRKMFSGPMRLPVFIQACHDLLTAVNFLHGKGLVHRCVGMNVMCGALLLHFILLF